MCHHRPVAIAKETAERIDLPGGPLEFTLRRSSRARRLRLAVDPRRGVVVTVPSHRPGARSAAAQVEPFIREREAWLRRHLDRHALERSGVASGSPEDLVDGARLRFRGIVHHLRVEAAPSRARRSTVLIGWSAAPDGGSLKTAESGRDGIREIVVRRVPADRRPLQRLLEGWLRERAAADLADAIRDHSTALAVKPVNVALRDPRTRWGSAARTGRLSFSWRLVLAPPEALETVVVHELAHLRVFGHGPEFWAVVASRVPDHKAWRRWLREHSVELHAALAT